MKKYLFPMLSNTSKPMVCKLTTSEQQKRRETVIMQLKKQVLEKKELSNGYAFRFTGTDEMLDQLTDFIKSERLCCDFFDFTIQVGNDAETWLEITGAEGVKPFIEMEVGL